jgi:integrating conjugative element membrane protein (TIGR03745 family)
MQYRIKLTTFFRELDVVRTLRNAAWHARQRLSLAFLTLATLPQAALADLPAIEPPTSGGGGDGLYDNIQGYAADAIILGGLLISAVGFLVVAGSAMGKFREATKRGEWGDFAIVVVVGVILLVLLIWLANKASEILVS